MERLEIFAPAILTVSILAIAVWIYIKWVVKKLGEDNLNSAQWVKNNYLKVNLLVGTPLVNIWAPLAEELLFRAPIILMFPNLEGRAWWGILISAGLFSLIHIKNKNVALEVALDARKETDNLSEKLNMLEAEVGRGTKIFKMCLRLTATFVLGIVSGYYGIKYQSLWLSVGIHALWNLLGPILLVVIVVLGMQIMGAMLATIQNGLIKLKDEFKKTKDKMDKNEW